MLFFILGFMNALNSSVFFYMDSSFFTKRSQDQEAVLKTKSRLAESLNESCHNSAKNSAFSEVDKIHSYFLFFSILHSKSLTGSPSALLHATDIKLYLSYTEKNKTRKLLGKLLGGIFMAHGFGLCVVAELYHMLAIACLSAGPRWESSLQAVVLAACHPPFTGLARGS